MALKENYCKESKVKTWNLRRCGAFHHSHWHLICWLIRSNSNHSSLPCSGIRFCLKTPKVTKGPTPRIYPLSGAVRLEWIQLVTCCLFYIIYFLLCDASSSFTAFIWLSSHFRGVWPRMEIKNEKYFIFQFIFVIIYGSYYNFLIIFMSHTLLFSTNFYLYLQHFQ